MSTKLNDNGFFSDEAQLIGVAIQHEHKQLFFYLSEVNEQAHRFLGQMKAGSRNSKQLLTAALFVRVLTAFQALILLARKGFGSEARSTCRNIIEAKFKLAYLLIDPDAALLMLAKHEKERAKALRKMKSGELPIPSEFKGQDWDGMIAEAESRRVDAKGGKLKTITIEEIAKKCGLQIDYYGYYLFFCEATHSGARELVQRIICFQSTTTHTKCFVDAPIAIKPAPETSDTVH